MQGKQAPAAVALPDAQKIAGDGTVGGSGTSVGMTLDKLKKAKKLLQKAHIPDFYRRYMVIGSDEEEALLTDSATSGNPSGLAQIASTDYNNQQVLRDGTLNGRVFYGFEFVISERLPTDSTNRHCFAFAEPALCLKEFLPVMSDVTRRQDLRTHPWQVYTMCSFGAVRVEDEMVVQIDCKA